GGLYIVAVLWHQSQIKAALQVYQPCYLATTKNLITNTALRKAQMKTFQLGPT
ncbi:uncharacterized protein METZ01_LOCUS245887, partial [marine metagenome]